MPRLTVLLIFAAVLLQAGTVLAESSGGKTLETRYTTIHYSEDAQLSDFLWRITGKRESSGVGELTRSRVDEIAEKVMDVLDMRPAPFHFGIFLQTEMGQGGPIAYYSHERRAINVLCNRVTDGVLAHEIAHAVMNAYFGIVPPEKSQEILAQYVDQHLWSEA